MTAFILKADGSKKPVKPANGTDFSLEEMQKIVGGYIEVVPTSDRRFLIVLDEEGKIKRLPINVGASVLYGNDSDYIVGDVLVTSPEWIK